MQGKARHFKASVAGKAILRFKSQEQGKAHKQGKARESKASFTGKPQRQSKVRQ
jgi:hypothetical protein